MNTANGKSGTRGFVRGVERALRRAARVARATARVHHTPIYIWRNGKVMAKKP